MSDSRRSPPPPRDYDDAPRGDALPPRRDAAPPSNLPLAGRRIYLGRLPEGVTKQDVESYLAPYSAVETRVMGNYAFVEMQSQRDVEEAVSSFQSKPMMGADITIQVARERDSALRRRDPYFEPPARGPRPGRGVPVIVRGVPPHTSWQDLKDFGREGGMVLFSDVRDGEGILEYPSVADAEDAIRRLERIDLHGARVECVLDAPRRGGGGGGDRGGYDRRPPPPMDGYGDRRGGGDDYYRRRSPPPRYDDRRGGGGGDRYGGDRYDDRDRRGDRDRESRYDDRRGERGSYRDDREPRGGDYDDRRGGAVPPPGGDREPMPRSYDDRR